MMELLTTIECDYKTGVGKIPIRLKIPRSHYSIIEQCPIVEY